MNKNMLLVVLLVAVVGCSHKDTTKTESDSDVLVEVNGKALTRGEAQRQMEIRLGGPPPADFSEAKIKYARDMALSRVVDQFVKKTLLLEEADKLGITVSEAEVEKGVAAIKAHSKGKDPKGMTQKGPAGDDSIRNEVMIGMKIDKLLAQKIPAKMPSDKEVDEFIAANAAKFGSVKDPKKREMVIKIMQTQARRNALGKYVKELQEKAEIKHGPNVFPPKYPDDKK